MSDSAWDDPVNARLPPISAARTLNDASCGSMATVAAARELSGFLWAAATA